VKNARSSARNSSIQFAMYEACHTFLLIPNSAQRKALASSATEQIKKAVAPLIVKGTGDGRERGTIFCATDENQMGKLQPW
jgi:hypothetical protein